MDWINWAIRFVALGGIGIVLMKAAVELFFFVAVRIGVIELDD